MRQSPVPILLVTVGSLACSRSPPVMEGAADRPADSASASLDSLTALADSLYRTGQYPEAREAWSAAWNRIQTDPDPATGARVLTSLGLTEWRLGDYDAARSRTEQARDLLLANKVTAQLPRTYNALGLIAWDQGRMSEAAELWRRTMEVARQSGDQEYIDKPAMNLGLWYAGIGDLRQAMESFTASLEAGRKLEHRALELRSMVNLAMVANRMGEPRLALAWLDSAAAQGVEEDFLAEDNYRSQLAIAAWALGDPGVALAGLDSAVAKARAAGLRQSEAANLTLMADIYWEAGDLSRALALHAQAEAIHGELELPTEQGQNFHSSARIQASLGHTQQARELARRALALHQQAEELTHQLDDRLLLAELGEPGHVIEARKLAAQLSTRSARTLLGLGEARLAAGAGRWSDVLGALGRIGPDLANGLSSEVAEAEALRAQAYGSLERWDSAVVAGRRAVAVMERIRSRHGSGLLRASFASFRSGTYGDLVSALLALDRVDEAFDVADAARWGSSQLAVSTDRQGTVREDLLRKIAVLESEIRSREEDGQDATELQERLRQAERAYEVALLSAPQASPSPSRPAQAGALRATLGGDEMMLAYLVTPDRLFVFSSTREQTRVHAEPVGATAVEASVRLARQLLADPRSDGAESGNVLGTLSRWLLAPLAAGSGVRRLIIVPHGVLAYVPFGALKTSDGRFLVERYSLAHLPAARYATEATASPMERGSPVALTALAPLTDDLPATAVEVRAIGRTHGRARVLVGRRAGETALRQALGSGDMTHVASHGVLNRMNPLFTRIELVPGRNRTPSDDGRLEVHEVLSLNIRSPLVFLSGCETGLGPGASQRYAPGEDYATLAAAFLAAGAERVVATLWAIADTGAAVFAARFYDELNRMDPVDALAASQRAMLNDARFRHPYYWAGYRLAGAGSKPRPAVMSVGERETQR